MRKIEEKAVGVLLLAVFSVACDSSPSEIESGTSVVLAGEASIEIGPASVAAQSVNQQTEIGITEVAIPEIDVPEVSIPEVVVPAVTIPEIVVSEIVVTEVMIPEIVVPEIVVTEVSIPEIVVPEIVVTEITIPEIDVPETAITDYDSLIALELAESLGLVNGNTDLTLSATEIIAGGIVDDSVDSPENTISVGSISTDSENTNGGTSASASVTATTWLELSELSGSSSGVFGSADNNYCSEVGDVFDLTFSGVLDDSVAPGSEVSLNSYVSLDLDSHPNVQLVSHSDESISVAVTESDIVDLALQYENQYDFVYLSAAGTNEPRPFVLKKQYQDGSCSFALYTDLGCAVVTSDVEVLTATVGETSITASGCILENPHSLPVIDVEE